VPGLQTGSTGETKVAPDDVAVDDVVAAGGGELLALRDERRPDAAARPSPVALVGTPLGSGFMMLMAGIDAALGKSASTTTFFWAWPAGGGLAASVAVEGGAASAMGVSAWPH